MKQSIMIQTKYRPAIAGYCKKICLLLLLCNSYWSPLYAQIIASSYREDTVNFSYNGHKIYGKLITPIRHPDKMPVVVFVHGSGPEDYSSSGNYVYLWQVFTNMGYACYAWDRPGVGQSEGKWYTMSVSDRADEVVCATQRLKELADIDTAKIGYWGISQAGWVIPIVAALVKPAFVITVSSPVTTAFEQELYRVRSEMKAEGYNQINIDKAIAYYNGLMRLIRTNAVYDSFALLQKQIDKEHWKDIVITGDEMVYDYLKIVFTKDRVPDLEGLSCPVLAIWGAHDLVVPPVMSSEVYKKEMARIGNHNALIKIIANADHTLTYNLSGMPAETRKRRTRYKDDPKEIFAPGYVDIMTQWLKKL
jgi:pimeloyl-ACP methyl ester carboxylesterase